MQVQVKPIPLFKTTSESSLVKSCALFAFRAVRSVADYVAELPDAATHAVADIRDAWEESSRPNA